MRELLDEDKIKKVKLTAICRPKQWKTIPTSDLKETGYPVYGANGIIGYYDKYNHEMETVAITCRGATCGTVNLTSPKAYITGNAMCLDDVDASVRTKYLYYAMQAFDFTSVISGSAQPQITREGLNDVTVRICSIKEQDEIINTLEKVDSVIENCEKQLDMFNQLIKSRFIEMFGDPLHNEKGWPCVVLTDVCGSILGGGTPSKSHLKYFTGDIPWVSPKDMKSLIICDSMDHITHEAMEHSTTNLVPSNSVLMVIRSGILKHTLPVAINSVPVTINQDMKAFVPNEKITSSFLMYYFKAIETDVLAGVRGVTADNIDFKTFQKRKIILPPMELQQQFAAFVQATDKSKAAIQKSLDELDILKKSLMQKYFG